MRSNQCHFSEQEQKHPLDDPPRAPFGHTSMYIQCTPSARPCHCLHLLVVGAIAKLVVQCEKVTYCFTGIPSSRLAQPSSQSNHICLLFRFNTPSQRLRNFETARGKTRQVHVTFNLLTRVRSDQTVVRKVAPAVDLVHNTSVSYLQETRAVILLWGRQTQRCSR